MERRKKEEAERKAKLDEIAEKQRQRERELEEKERQRREEILGRSAAAPAIAAKSDISAGDAPPATAAAAPTPAAGKFVPRFRRAAAEAGGQAPPPATDKWTSGSRPEAPAGDRWRDDRRPAPPGGTGTRTWQSSREERRR